MGEIQCCCGSNITSPFPRGEQIVLSYCIIFSNLMADIPILDREFFFLLIQILLYTQISVCSLETYF